MISNKLTTPPATEPITTTQLDNHLRGDGVLESMDGDILTLAVQWAREFAENYTRKALITQSWTMYLDGFPSDPTDLGWWDGVREGSMSSGVSRSLTLPVAPLQSVTSISTFSRSNIETVFDPSNYFLNNHSDTQPGEIILNDGVVWPVNLRSRLGVKIEYVAGYGDNVTDIPAPLRGALLQLGSHWYENREFIKTQSDQNQAHTPLHILSMLKQYRGLGL